MITPAALIAAPLAAASITLPPARPIDPADLWTAGVDLTAAELWTAGADLTAAELSSLLDDCTGWTVDADTAADGDPAFYLVDPSGDRDPDPFEDLADLADHVGWRIDEALADCAP